VGYRQTNQKTDTGKTLTRWPVFVDHFRVWEERKQTATLQIEECRNALQTLSDRLAAMEMTLTLSSGDRDELDQRIHQHEKNKPGLLANLFSLGRISKAWWDRYQRLTDESDSLRATLTQQRQELQLAQSENEVVY
ncbi:hypothetical protein ACH63W_00105, partial [Klebsiella pneumoniae]